jgi:hypothetical protein
MGAATITPRAIPACIPRKEAPMKKFLVLYRSPVSARQQMANTTPEMGKAMMDQWMAWAKRAGGAIVEMGAPLGEPAILGKGEEGSIAIGGFSVLQGENADAVKRALDGHPHLSMPGGFIEVLEYLPVPGM